MGQQRFELLSSGNAIMDLQIISQDEQLWLDAAAVVEDLLLHGRLFIVAWGMTLLWSTTYAHAKRLNPSSARWHQRAACKASRFPTSKGGSQAR